MNFKVVPCERNEIKNFIEKWHYSKSINGLKSSYCFKLIDGTKLIGGMIYGYLGMASVWKKYVTAEEKLIELRRLCCIDATPKNTESYFIAKTIHWLRHNTKIQKIISYADPNFGHEGIIYKASNFERLGLTAGGRVIIYGEKRYHDKTIRTKYNGIIKPYAQKIKTALERGDAHYKKQVGKHIYLFDLRSKKNRR